MTADGCIWIVSNQPTPYRAPVLEALRRLRPELRIVEIYRFPRATDREWDVPDVDHQVFLRDGGHHPGLSVSLREPIRFLRLAKSLPRPKIIVAGGYEAPLLFLVMVLLARSRSVRLLLWAGTHEHSSLDRSLAARLWRWVVFHQIDGLIAYSTSAARYARQMRAALKVDVVGNAHRQLSTGPRQPLEQDNGTTRILYVGRIVSEKRVDLLVRGAELWSVGQKREIVVALAGSDVGGIAPVSSIIDVQLLGHLDEAQLAHEVAQADLLALISDFDPWGLVVNEAMELGTITLVDTRIGCVPDLADATTALVGRFRSSADVAAAIEVAATLGDEAEALRARACKRVEDFRPERVAARIEAALTRHMEQHSEA